VVDGDTITINHTRLRFLNMDAFESYQNCQKDGRDYACGFEATAALVDLVRGKEVRCEGDGRDRYGRPLVHCWVGSLDLGREIVRLGWAVSEFGNEYRRDEQMAHSARLTGPHRFRERPNR
jgi:endonuclease YncB( thermonuclease family)